MEDPKVVDKTLEEDLRLRRVIQVLSPPTAFYLLAFGLSLKVATAGFVGYIVRPEGLKVA